MKLGYSIWTTSRSSPGRTVAGNTGAMNDTDANEPLLTNHESSNLVIDYYAHTRAAFQSGGVSTGSYVSQCPSRTICSPQHPSQDLIEMLNRNQQASLIRKQVKPQEQQQQQKHHHHQQQQQQQQQQLLSNHQTGENEFNSVATEDEQRIEFNMQNIRPADLKQWLDPRTPETNEVPKQNEENDHSNVEPNQHIHTTDAMLNGTLLSNNNSVSSNNSTLCSQNDVEDLDNDVGTDAQSDERQSLLN